MSEVTRDDIDESNPQLAITEDTSEVAEETEGAAYSQVSSVSVTRSTRNGFSSGLLSLDQPMYCNNLEGCSDLPCRAIEFSDDGSLLVSGGGDGRILIWNIEQVLDSPLRPTPLVVQSEKFDCSLAVSTDNSRIFATVGPQILIYDTRT